MTKTCETMRSAMVAEIKQELRTNEPRVEVPRSGRVEDQGLGQAKAEGQKEAGERKKLDLAKSMQDLFGSSNPYRGREQGQNQSFSGSDPYRGQTQVRMAVNQRAPQDQGQWQGQGKRTAVREEYPAIVIKGIRTQPVSSTFEEIMARIGLRGVKTRLQQVMRFGRSFILKALMWSQADVERVMRNRHMLRSNDLFIDQDRLPFQWREAVKQMEERELQEQAAKKAGEEENRRMQALRSAPRTEHFQAIHEAISREWGNRNQGNGGRRARENGRAPWYQAQRWVPRNTSAWINL